MFCIFERKQHRLVWYCKWTIHVSRLVWEVISGSLRLNIITMNWKRPMSGIIIIKKQKSWEVGCFECMFSVSHSPRVICVHLANKYCIFVLCTHPIPDTLNEVSVNISQLILSTCSLHILHIQYCLQCLCTQLSTNTLYAFSAHTPQPILSTSSLRNQYSLRVLCTYFASNNTISVSVGTIFCS